MNETLDFIEIGTDEEIIQKTGTEQYVKLTSPNTALYVALLPQSVSPMFPPMYLLERPEIICCSISQAVKKALLCRDIPADSPYQWQA